MIPKKILSLILCFILLTSQGVSASDGIILVEGQDQYLHLLKEGDAQVCERPDVGASCSLEATEHTSVEELSPVLTAASTTEPPSCNNKDFQLGDKPLPDEEAEAIKHDLLKQCNRAYKKHKRAFAKQLFRNGRLFGAMKVLMRKKKKLKDIESNRNSESVTAQSDSLEDLNKKIDEEEKKIIEAFKKEFPGGFNESDPYYVDNKSLCNGMYSLGVDGQMSTPSHIYVEKGDVLCKVAVEVPKVKTLQLPPANLIPPLDITDSFPDDCAFMVSDKFTEADALKLLGAKTRGDYCSNNQVIDKNDEVRKDAKGNSAFDYLDQLSDSFTEAAQEGLTPDFTLNVSRNLYRDEVRPLAEKRGEFVQKYLFSKLKENAKELSDAPPWMTDFSEFSKIFKLKFPSYDGDSTVGDFGPNPYASEAEFDKEKQNLRTTLEKKQSEIKKSISLIEDSANGSIKRLSDSIAKDKKLKKELEKKLSFLSHDIEKKTDFKDVETDFQSINEMNQEIYKVAYRIAQTERTLKEENDLLSYHKSKLAKTSPSAQVNLLDQFYKSRPGTFDRDYKEQWDEKLFKQFKMVAVEGTFKGEKEFNPDLDEEITPKIQYAMEKIINSQSFSCNYSIEDHYRRKLEWDDGNFKIGKFSQKFLWNPVFMSIKFVLGGELLLLGKLAKKIPGPLDCPSFGRKNYFRSYMRWGSKKVHSVGQIGKFDVDKRPLASYQGSYDQCVEEEAK